MMELTENKKEKGIWKLPKNVRQIGEPGSSTRILIEDYAYTYLHQMAEQNLTLSLIHISCFLWFNVNIHIYKP